MKSKPLFEKNSVVYAVFIRNPHERKFKCHSAHWGKSQAQTLANSIKELNEKTEIIIKKSKVQIL